jgi:hypothetical protein
MRTGYEAVTESRYFLKEHGVRSVYGYTDDRDDQCPLYGRLPDPPELKNVRCKLDGYTPINI